MKTANLKSATIAALLGIGLPVARTVQQIKNQVIIWKH